MDKIKNIDLSDTKMEIKCVDIIITIGTLRAKSSNKKNFWITIELNVFDQLKKNCMM